MSRERATRRYPDSYSPACPDLEPHRMDQQMLLTNLGARLIAVAMLIASAIVFVSTPRPAAAESGNDLILGGDPVSVPTEAFVQRTLTLDLMAGQTVALRIESHSDVSYDLHPPSGPAIAAYGFSSVASVGPVEVPATGTYTLNFATWRAEPDLTVQAFELDPAPPVSLPLDGDERSLYIGPFEKGQFLLDLTEGRRINVIGETGRSGANVELHSVASPSVKTAAVQSGTRHAIIAYDVPATGEYVLTIDPSDTESGRYSFHAFDVSQPINAPVVVDGSASQIREVLPGQLAEFRFDGNAGQRYGATVLSAASDAEVRVIGPGGGVIREWEPVNGPALPGQEDVVIFDAPSAGTYALQFRNGFRSGLFEVRLVPLTRSALIGLSAGSSPTSFQSDERGESFSFAAGTPVDTRGVFNLVADPEFSGTVYVGGEGGDPVWVPTGSEVSIPFEAETEFLVETTRPGMFFVSVDSHEPPGRTTVDGPPVQVNLRAYSARIDFDVLAPQSTVRIVGLSDHGNRFDLAVVGPEWFVESTYESDGLTFAATSAGEYSVYIYGDQRAGQGTLEVFSQVGTPRVALLDAAGLPVGPEDFPDSASISVPSVGTLQGYAVALDQSPTTDPGTLPTHSLTQGTAVDLTGLPAGDHWIHVRGIDALGHAGPVASLPVHVAPFLASGAAMGPVEASPGSPGYVSTETPTLTVEVQTTLGGGRAHFVVSDAGSGEAKWRGYADVVSGKATVSVPKGYIDHGQEYEVRAVYLADDGRVGQPTGATQFVWRLMSPIAPAPPCEGPDCHAASGELFLGAFPADGEVVMDTSALTSVEVSENDWIDSIDLQLVSDSPNPIPVAVYGESDLESQVATVHVGNSATTVRVWPDLDGRVTIRDLSTSGAAGHEISVTVLAWQSGYTQALKDHDEAIESREDEILMSAQDVRDVGVLSKEIVDFYSIENHAVLSDGAGGLPSDNCSLPNSEEVVACAIADNSERTQLFGTTMAGQDPAPRWEAELTIPPLKDSVVEAYLLREGLPTECNQRWNWVALTRFKACRVLTPAYTMTMPTLFPGVSRRGGANLILVQEATFDATSRVMRFTSKPFWANTHGADIITSVSVINSFSCILPNCAGPSTGNTSHTVSTLTKADRQGGTYRTSIEFQSMNLQDVRYYSTGTSSYGVMLAGNGGPTGEMNFDGPIGIRCDRRSEVKMFARDMGCVYKDARVLVPFYSSLFPNHSLLVEDGQRDLFEHPGMIQELSGDATRPLTRRPAKPAGNRKMARQKCRKMGISKPESCDEYPYNSTNEGCKTGLQYVPPGEEACLVWRTPLRENVGAGAVLLAALRAQRVLVGDEYWVTVDFSSPWDIPSAS